MRGPVDCSGLQDRTSLRRGGFRLGGGGGLHCSGLQDRTSLRPSVDRVCLEAAVELFRSPRPDFIETRGLLVGLGILLCDCSGLQDRTSLRRQGFFTQRRWVVDCSGLQDRTSLRPGCGRSHRPSGARLFRSPRPDFIETTGRQPRRRVAAGIVPVSKTGLH